MHKYGERSFEYIARNKTHRQFKMREKYIYNICLSTSGENIWLLVLNKQIKMRSMRPYLPFAQQIFAALRVINYIWIGCSKMEMEVKVKIEVRSTYKKNMHNALNTIRSANAKPFNKHIYTVCCCFGQVHFGLEYGFMLHPNSRCILQSNGLVNVWILKMHAHSLQKKQQQSTHNVYFFIYSPVI